MSKSLEKKIRANRVAVPMRFKETLSDSQGRKRESFNIYNVYVKPSNVRRINDEF